jgi:PAS domain S-box-containing protein
MKIEHQFERMNGDEPRMDQADARTKQADARTKQADARTKQADTRTKQADTRTNEANTRTDEANARTIEANTRTDEANTRTEQEMLRSVQAILASELRYRRLFETAQDGILILDASTGQVVDANPFMKDLLGYSHQEFMGKKLWEIGPFKGEEASKLAFGELQSADQIRYEGLPLETKDGRRVEVEFISNAYLVDKKLLIQCNIRNITERKEVEEKLRRKNAFLEAQMDSALDGIFVVDDQGKIISQNQPMSNLWKIFPHIAENKDAPPQIQFIASQTKNPRQFADKAAHLYSHPDEVSRDEVELIDGTVLDCYSSPVRDRVGKHYGRIWTFRDISKRPKLQA